MYKAERTDFAYLVGYGNRSGLKQAIKFALQYRPRGLCINPVVYDYIIQNDEIFRLYEQLGLMRILRQYVIDFPLGQGGYAGKILLAEDLIENDLVDEFDVVANIGAIINNDYEKFSSELHDLIALNKPVKVIVETGYYAHDDGPLERAVYWCANLGVYAIKTSTGIIEKIDNETKRKHVALWRNIINRNGYDLKIKDSGGKTTREDIDKSLAAGADIVGISSVIL
ncbi:MAG: hypothetical protein Q8L47_03770 [bacterium]|nr:hypothetical protein [bacterium]